MKNNLDEARAFELVACALASEHSKLDDGTLGLQLGLHAERTHGQVGFRIFASWFEQDKCHRVEGNRISLRDFDRFKFQIDITHLLRDVSRVIESKRNALLNGLHAKNESSANATK